MSICRISIVVPTYREAANLPILLERIRNTMAGSHLHYEVVVVDDNSPDDTQQCIERLRQDGHPVRLIVRTQERGLSSAVIRGLNEAQGEYLACMDADLSHPPEALPRMLERVANGSAELVIGSRYVAGGSTDASWGLFRWLNSKIATLLAVPLCPGVKDPMAGFFLLPHKVYARAQSLNPIGYKILLELICKCRIRRFGEEPIHFEDRKLGQSKLSFKEQLRYLRHLYRLYRFQFRLFSELVHFCSIGASGVLVDMATVHLVYHGLIASMSAARCAGIAVAMLWNFWLNRHLTFRYARQAPQLPQLGRYVAACSLGALINWGVSMTLFNYAPWFAGRVARSALAGVVAGTANNFLLSKRFAFGTPITQEKSEPVIPGIKRSKGNIEPSAENRSK